MFVERNFFPSLSSGNSAHNIVMVLSKYTDRTSGMNIPIIGPMARSACTFGTLDWVAKCCINACTKHVAPDSDMSTAIVQQSETVRDRATQDQIQQLGASTS